MSKSKKSNEFMSDKQKLGVGILAGIAAGFGIGWLLYSERGQEVRSEAADKLDDVSHRVGDVSKSVADSVNDEIDKLKHKVTDTFKKGRMAAAERLAEAEKKISPKEGNATKTKTKATSN